MDPSLQGGTSEVNNPIYVENCEITSIVEALYEYTPRDIKRFVSTDYPNFIEIPQEKTGPGIKQRVDLTKICKFLPRHILACLLKEDEQYWIPYLIKAQKLLNHLIRFAKKRGGALAQQIHLAIPKIIDMSMLASVVAIQTMASTTDISVFEASLELFRQIFSLLDYFLDAELSQSKQPFMDALVVHPKLDIFNTAIIDGLELIVHHRSLLPFRPDGKANASITRTLIAVFDVLDILAMSDDYVSRFMGKSKGYLLVNLCLTIFKDYAKLGLPVLFGTMKVLYRLCEEETTFIDAVINSPACTRFNLIVSFVIDVISDILTQSKFTHAIRSEATKIIYALCRESNYRRLIIDKGTFFFLNFFSQPPTEFAHLLKDTAVAEKAVYIFVTMGYLHSLEFDQYEKSFFDVVVDILKSKPSSILLKKAYSSPQNIYAPSIVTNLNSTLSELLVRPKWREELSLKVTKRQAYQTLAFRNDLEKAMSLNSGHFDSLIETQFEEWNDQAPVSRTSRPNQPLESTQPPTKTKNIT